MKAFMIAEELILSPLLVMFFLSLIGKMVVKHFEQSEVGLKLQKVEDPCFK